MSMPQEPTQQHGVTVSLTHCETMQQSKNNSNFECVTAISSRGILSISIQRFKVSKPHLLRNFFQSRSSPLLQPLKEFTFLAVKVFLA